MNKILGDNIARLRKERKMTQEDLAKELNITYQAVSKWENGVSSPDISNLKLIAGIFGVTIDELFGLSIEQEKQETAVPEADDKTLSDDVPCWDGTIPEEKVSSNRDGLSIKTDPLPWDDDDTLRVVAFRGHRLLSADEIGGSIFGRKNVQVNVSGESADVFSYFDVKCDSVNGNIGAGGDVDCGIVTGSINAGGDVSCAAVGGNISAGGDVDCENVNGYVRAGGDVDCSDVGGDVQSSGDVDCGTVIGSVSAGGDVDCGRVGGSVSSSGK